MGWREGPSSVGLMPPRGLSETLLVRKPCHKPLLALPVSPLERPSYLGDRDVPCGAYELL